MHEARCSVVLVEGKERACSVKMEIEAVVNVGATQGITCGIVPAVKGPRDVEPAAVAMLASFGGRTVKLMLSTIEARALGEALLVAGCIAEGGQPPVLAPAPASPLILNGRH